MTGVMDFGCFVELQGFRTKQVGAVGGGSRQREDSGGFVGGQARLQGLLTQKAGGREKCQDDGGLWVGRPCMLPTQGRPPLVAHCLFPS